jgi:hypothetical protein
MPGKASMEERVNGWRFFFGCSAQVIKKRHELLHAAFLLSSRADFRSSLNDALCRADCGACRSICITSTLGARTGVDDINVVTG